MKALLAFEMVMRLGSMTAAAHELGSTQPAISQRIRALEETVGVPLFERHGSRLQATFEGKRFHVDTRNAIRDIATATQRLQTQALNQKPELTIAAHFGVAHLWLLPLLPALEAALPSTRFEVIPVDQDNAPAMDSADLTIRFGQLDGLANNDYPLFTEIVYPVCSPAFAARHRLNHQLPAQSVPQLPLLHMDHQDPRWLDWYRWCDMACLPQPQHPPRFAYNNYPLLLNAASNGAGIALGWQTLVDPMIRAGALLRLDPVVQRNKYGYLLSVRHPERATIARVVQWLLNAARS